MCHQRIRIKSDWKWDKQLSDRFRLEIVVHNPEFAEMYLHTNGSKAEPVKIGAISMNVIGEASVLYYDLRQLTKNGLAVPDAVKEFTNLWMTRAIMQL